MKAKKQSSKGRLVKVPMSVYLDTDQVKALRALSERTGAPVNYYMREGVKLILAQHNERKP
jgi:hypothetical protein